MQAEEITLTIGQAFDLAYRRFLETSGKDLEVQRRLMLLQQKVKRLETENSTLRQRLNDVAQIKGQVGLYHLQYIFYGSDCWNMGPSSEDYFIMRTLITLIFL